MPTTRIGLWFDTQALEAAEYYVAIFPNSEISHVSYWGPENPDRQGTPLVVLFTLDGREFSAVNGGPDFPFTEAISIEIECADQTELDYYWNTLSRGGSEVQCGWLKDRYGLSWQVTPRRLGELMTDPDPARVQRVKEAMFAMVKLDVATLEAAAEAG